MGRKAKIGKRRKDKFYHLAKETGYRARSAFKLIQLNRKYQFLQQSRVLVDLCAAPGGWLQVAAKFMPISSLIIGIDLVPIKSIPNVITLQEDITTERCRQQLQRELKTWKIDCMLNDGAPNVGSAWVQDAFSQAELTLSAVKLACTFLREGGWFITKVFRSKDYQPLLWVLQQLFKKVHATKPQASRNESAEIFVVCQGYIAPKKIDPKLLDSRYVFAEVEEDKAEQKISLTKLQKPSKSAEGYPDDARVLYKVTSVADFITGDDHLTVLSTSNKLEFDKTGEVFSRHPLTSDEIKQSCEDLKVLGPRELKQLVKWREKMRKFLDDAGSDSEGDAEGSKGGDGMGRESMEEEEGKDKMLEGIDDKIKSLEKSEAAEIKREIKRLRRQRHKLKERLVMKGDVYRETSELTRQEDLFCLGNIKSRNELEEVERGEMETSSLVSREDDEEEREESENLSGSENEEMEESEIKGESDEPSGDSGEESDSEGSESEEVMSDDNNQMEKSNPLLVSLENSAMAASARSKKAKLWFSKSAFDGLENDEDDDLELDQMVSSHSRDKKEAISESVKEKKMVVNKTAKETCSETKNELRISDDDSMESDGGSSAEDDCSYNSSDSDSEEERLLIEQAKAAAKKSRTDSSIEQGKGADNGSFEVVPANSQSNKLCVRKLDPEGLAIGALMVQSKKKHEDLIESGYNRWTHNDDNLPDWFLADESKYCQKTLPITKEMVEVYRAKLKEINNRPIRKIAEAKARKKKRALKKLERARKKAESIADLGEDVSAQEKAQQIKQVYKKAGVLGKRKREVEYVVAKKGVGKRVKRPAGVKGHFKVVDPRMKKDTRGKAAGRGRGQRSGGRQQKRRKH